jgi:hypothetical protein
MILDDVYENFVNDTGLTNAVYKSVFSKISEHLEKIGEFEFTGFSYEVGDNKFDLDLSEKMISLNVVEIINNIFQDFYTFPGNSSVVLRLNYNDVPCELRYVDGKFSASSQIVFFKQNNLFDMFISIKPVDNLFKEFDRLFRFYTSFINYPSNVFSPLRSKFENRLANNNIETNPLLAQQLNEDKLICEKLKMQQTELSEELENKQITIQEIQGRRSKLEFSNKNLIQLNEEKARLKAEHALMLQHIGGINEEFVNISEVVVKIDIELSNLSSQSDVSESDVNYLKEKKIIFSQEAESRKKTIIDTQSFINRLTSRMAEIDEAVMELESLSSFDIYSDDAALKVLEVERDNIYVNLSSVQDQLKKIQEKIASNSLTLEKSNLNNNNMYEADMSSISEHLSSSFYSIPIAAVFNYLRYYFVYSCQEFMKSMRQEEDGDLRSMSARYVLGKNFNIKFKNYFTYFTNELPNHTNPIIVTRS